MTATLLFQDNSLTVIRTRAFTFFLSQFSSERPACLSGKALRRPKAPSPKCALQLAHPFSWQGREKLREEDWSVLPVTGPRRIQGQSGVFRSSARATRVVPSDPGPSTGVTVHFPAHQGATLSREKWKRCVRSQVSYGEPWCVCLKTVAPQVPRGEAKRTHEEL